MFQKTVLASWMGLMKVCFRRRKKQKQRGGESKQEKDLMNVRGRDKWSPKLEERRKGF